MIEPQAICLLVLTGPWTLRYVTCLIMSLGNTLFSIYCSHDLWWICDLKGISFVGFGLTRWTYVSRLCICVGYWIYVLFTFRFDASWFYTELFCSFGFYDKWLCICRQYREVVSGVKKRLASRTTKVQLLALTVSSICNLFEGSWFMFSVWFWFGLVWFGLAIWRIMDTNIHFRWILVILSLIYFMRK